MYWSAILHAFREYESNNTLSRTSACGKRQSLRSWSASEFGPFVANDRQSCKLCARTPIVRCMPDDYRATYGVAINDSTYGRGEYNG